MALIHSVASVCCAQRSRTRFGVTVYTLLILQWWKRIWWIKLELKWETDPENTNLQKHILCCSGFSFHFYYPNSRKIEYLSEYLVLIFLSSKCFSSFSLSLTDLNHCCDSLRVLILTGCCCCCCCFSLDLVEISPQHPRKKTFHRMIGNTCSFK